MIEGYEIVCKKGVIATGPADAARAGAKIFTRGGNAMDAASAACLVCAVLEPQAVDLGGYVLAAVVLDGKTGRVWSVDANSVAPEAARENMYQVLPPEPGKLGINEIEYACSVRDDANVYGPLSVGVPGFMAGVGTIWERWGQLKWHDIIAPARELVQGGLEYSLIREAILTKRDVIAKFPSTASILLPWDRRDLIRTLGRLEEAGWRDFYQGEIGRAIADFISSQCGILTRQDMARFSPRVTEPCSGTYHNAKIHTAIAPNGGFSVLAALADMETAEVIQWPAVLQRMWRRRLNPSREGATRHGTIHIATADNQGNLASVTSSQGGLFGSCLAVPDTGIILGHGMCRFDPHPGLDNSPGSRKRPLNNVCPLIIRTADRDVAIGARGGRRIVSVTPQIAQKIIDNEASVRAASIAPRMHTITGDPIEISQNFDPRIREQLEAIGYRIEVVNEVAGAAHGAEILKTTGQLRAGGNTWATGV